MQESIGGFVHFVQIGQANDARIEQVFGNNNNLRVIQFNGGPINGNGYPEGGPGYPEAGPGYPGGGYYAYGYLQELLNQNGGIIFDGNGYWDGTQNRYTFCTKNAENGKSKKS